jgi:hypothetical protein
MNGANGDRSLRNFYDPVEEMRFSDGEFFNKIAESRAVINLGGLCLTGYDVIAAEAFHAGITIHPEVVFECGGIAPLNDKLRQLDTHAQEIADRIAQTAGSYEGVSSDYLPILASRIFATIAHNGQVRRNGKPYISHPNAVANIIQAGYDEVGQDPENKKAAHIISGYTHDAFEDTWNRDGTYLERPVLATPRVLQRLLESYELPYATTVGQTNRLLAHNKGMTKKTKYGTYITDGASRGGSDFIITKIADLTHNSVLDPEVYPGTDPEKIDKLAQKEKRYLNAADELMNASVLTAVESDLVHVMFNIVDNKRLAAVRARVPKVPIDIQLVAA